MTKARHDLTSIVSKQPKLVASRARPAAKSSLATKLAGICTIAHGAPALTVTATARLASSCAGATTNGPVLHMVGAMTPGEADQFIIRARRVLRRWQTEIDGLAGE